MSPYLSLICFAEADDLQILPARRDNHRMETAIEPGHHEQARFAIIAARILRNDRGVPIEISHAFK
jgi:hypothetical protein